MGEAAKKIIDWKRPDFIDINFGCPVNKVVAKNGGSSLLKDCAMLAAVAAGVVRAVGGQVPVTAKIRIGWDEKSVNAVDVAKMLEDCGIRAIAVHGRTRSQGYGGEADWEVIDEVARAVTMPVIGNGDITCGADVLRRKQQTAVAGVMIGRAAMHHPWVFREAKHFLQPARHPPESAWKNAGNWSSAIAAWRWPAGVMATKARHSPAMRSRLMAYCKGFPGREGTAPEPVPRHPVADVEDLAARGYAKDGFY